MPSDPYLHQSGHHPRVRRGSRIGTTVLAMAIVMHVADTGVSSEQPGQSTGVCISDGMKGRNGACD